MDHINRVVQRASVWFHFGRWVRLFLFSLTLLTACMLLAHIASRLLSFRVDWLTSWLWGVGACAVVSFVWMFVTRADRLAVARLVDEGAQLKESISTALTIEGQDDPWSRATIEHARQASSRVIVRQAIPMRAPKWWAMPMVIFALFFAAGLIPQMDLLKLVQKAEAKEQERVAVEQAKKDVEAIEKELEKTLSKLGADKPETGGEAGKDQQKPQTPDDIRREALKKLTTAQDRLAELSEQGKSDMLNALKDKLDKVDSTQSPGPMAKLTQSLQQGDFGAAKEALSEMQKQLESGSMSEEDRKKLAEQMNKLATQLAEAAKDQAELEKKLKEAGLDPKLAKDANALEKALAEAQNLSPEQKEALQKQAKANQQASQACQKMGGACAGMAQSMAQGQDGEMAGEQLGEQLSELEMAGQQLDEMAAAKSAIAKKIGELGECMNPGACEGQGDEIRPGPGRYTNTPQQGAGQRDMQEAAFKTKKEKSNSKDTGGPIIGSTLVEGEQVKGESVQQFSDMVTAAESTAAEAIESKQIPREYHDAIKQYFGRLKSRTAQPAGAPSKDTEKPAEPAPSAEPAKKS